MPLAVAPFVGAVAPALKKTWYRRFLFIVLGAQNPRAKRVSCTHSTERVQERGDVQPLVLLVVVVICCGLLGAIAAAAAAAMSFAVVSAAIRCPTPAESVDASHCCCWFFTTVKCVFFSFVFSFSPHRRQHLCTQFNSVCQAIAIRL